eukprot:scpid10434/ scgid12689/ Retrovirus-related Pol polyprotein from transposon 412; Protease; Reverse transcriptase; Endonuclease
MVSMQLYSRLPDHLSLSKSSLPRLQSVNGSPVSVLGKLSVSVTVGGRAFRHDVLVADIQPELVLGLDFLDLHACILDTSNRRLTFEPVPASNNACRLDNNTPPPFPANCRVRLTESICIQPFSQVILPVVCDAPLPTGDFLLEPRPDLHAVFDISATYSVVLGPLAEPVPLRAASTHQASVTLKKGTWVATVSPCSVDPESSAPADALPVHATHSSVDSVASLFDLAHLGDSERSAVSLLLEEFSCCISTDSGDVGRTGVVQHNIDTGTARPIRQAPRRLPVHQQTEVRDHVDRLLDDGIITPSSSPWAAPIVVVRKPDNSIRLCVDYRKLNGVTCKDAFPMPRVDDAIDHMNGARFFSTLDLASGYWQVELENSSKAKAAFATPFGLYEWNVMPFGLCNAPATFQRLMTTVLQGLIPDVCLDYLDDIIVHAQSFNTQLTRLRSVFERLKSAGLKVRPSKCRLFQPSVVYLGHTFSAEGVAPNRQKTAAVREWPTPDSSTKVRQFLGFVSYYRRFIQNFSAVAKPLLRLTHKNVPFVWSSEAQSSFDRLKSCLLSAPVLGYPDSSRAFILDTDASDYAIGAVLSQADDQGREVVIAYGSATLSKSRKNYTATNRECFAVVHFCESFRHYLLGSKFTLRTDHAALVWLASFKSPDGMLARWIERLSIFDYNIVHRPGTKHANADALSHLPAVCVSVVTAQECAAGAAPDMLSLQSADRDISAVLNWLSTTTPLRGDPALQTASPSLLKLWQQIDRLVIKDGLLVRRYDTTAEPIHQLIVPSAIRQDILTALHTDAIAAHLGITKTADKARQRYYWPGMTSDIEVFIRACPVCQARQGPVPKPAAPLRSQQSSFPLQRVAMDIMGPLPATARQNRYILVIGDYFTKWVEAFAMPDMLASTVARYFVDGFVCRYGVPLALHTDQGPQFESRLMQTVCKLLDITKTRTTAYHPQSDGMIERFNRTLEKMLSACVTDHQEWDLHLQRTMFAYRSCVHASTQHTPSRLMFGRELVLPLDIMYGSPPRPHPDYPLYVQQLEASLKTAFANARQLNALALRRQKKGYDGTVHTKPRLQVGAEVSVFSPVVPKGKSPKLHSYWSGPFVVRKVLDSVTATIEDASKGQRLTVHVNRLKPYIRPPEVPVAPAQYTAQINPTCDDDLPVPLAGPPPRYNLRPRNALQRPHRYRQP